MSALQSVIAIIAGMGWAAGTIVLFQKGFIAAGILNVVAQLAILLYVLFGDKLK